ncbi:MAG TPA: MFS transporter [Solirubrobacteraceae bacterium]
MNEVAPKEIRKVAVASLVGTTIEYYDFFLYATAAALVFGDLFFPTLSPLAGTLASFGTFAIGFVARPVGGIVFGHYGDRIGRKRTLVLTLLLMGIATTAIGLVPTYASIGAWAPVILIALRFLQGFAVGGEWGGAALLCVEYAPAGRRGFYGSWPQFGLAIGLLLTSGVFTMLSGLSDAQFNAWGWRIPFLFSVALLAVGLWVRLRIAESPAFVQMVKADRAVRWPILVTLRSQPRRVLALIGTHVGDSVVFYFTTAFLVSYGVTQLELSKGTILRGVMIAAAIEIVTIPLFAHLSDRIGRKPIYAAGALFWIAFAFPAFLLLGTKDPSIIVLTMVLGLSIGHALMYAVQPAFYAEAFDTNVRYTGISLAYQVAPMIGGGLAPFIGTALLERAGGHYWPVAVYVAAMCAITAMSVAALPETFRRRSLLDDAVEPETAQAAPVEPAPASVGV